MDSKNRQYYYIEKCKEWLSEKEIIEKRKFYACVTTFGCQMNSRDSEKLVGILDAIGFLICEDEKKADFVIYNTCTVRENANLKVYGHLGILKNRKKKNNDFMIALCGCMMQEEKVIENIKKNYKFVDLVFGTHNLYMFAELLYKRIESGKQSIDVWKDKDGKESLNYEIVEELPVNRKFTFKSGVNIMFGCNNFCTYCIVPYVRGRERSRKPEDIINEIKMLTDDGVVEIMLLGQNVNSYGKTLDEPVTFAKLLQMIEEQVPKLKRIRFMTPHPKDLSDELIDVIANSRKIARQIHLPIQSGSTRLLKLMNRHYTKDDYLKLIDRIKAKVPDAGFTTDIIVGFPGETDEDFEETIDVVKKVKYDSAFTFIYSKRTGTPAATMPNQVPEEIIKERFDRLLSIVKEISNDITKNAVGQTVEVLVEEVNSQDETMVTGKMSNNTVVHFKGDKALIGSLVNVKINEAKGFYYIASRID